MLDNGAWPAAGLYPNCGAGSVGAFDKGGRWVGGLYCAGKSSASKPW